MALAIDGTPVIKNATALSTSLSLTTTSAHDVIIVFVECNGGPAVSVTSTHVTFTHRGGTTGGFSMEEWYGIASSALTAESITVTQTTSAFLTVLAFGISGANTSSPFDSHSGLPATANGGNPSITTSNANDIIIGGFRLSSASTSTAGTGFTLLGSSNNITGEYKIVSATQSALSVSQSATNNGAVADAIVAASPATYPYTRSRAPIIAR